MVRSTAGYFGPWLVACNCCILSQGDNDGPPVRDYRNTIAVAAPPECTRGHRPYDVGRFDCMQPSSITDHGELTNNIFDQGN